MIGTRFGPISPTVFVARVAIKLRRASCSPDLPRNGGEYLQLVGTITSPNKAARPQGGSIVVFWVVRNAPKKERIYPNDKTSRDLEYSAKWDRE